MMTSTRSFQPRCHAPRGNVLRPLRGHERTLGACTRRNPLSWPRSGPVPFPRRAWERGTDTIVPTSLPRSAWQRAAAAPRPREDPRSMHAPQPAFVAAERPSCIPTRERGNEETRKTPRIRPGAPGSSRGLGRCLTNGVDQGRRLLGKNGADVEHELAVADTGHDGGLAQAKAAGQLVVAES